jgi:hypothetical protein
MSLYCLSLLLISLTGVACNRASPIPGIGGAWFLEVSNYSAGAVIVAPWVGSPKSTITCGNGMEFRDGSPGAPPLPWGVVVAEKAGGAVVLDQSAGAAGAPSQEVDVENGVDNQVSAFMRNAGGSLAFPGPCTSP